ncbi:Aldo keto reductase [Seminavis robusta]|uniref:Aldo keto reductase n=1 Tax=Seminavis robusta TaxID=568900 RepID=A0A9N8DYV6_9STRA|nr:Aldo keto reductase [Seminavis robusta]|eukprot:Sro485_g152420.1 Aldo keto reductase (604) ;mRNA; f:35424-37749
MNKETIGVATALAGATAGLVYLYTSESMKGSKKSDDLPDIFQDDTLGPQVKRVIAKHMDKFTSSESIIKIVRQLDFWYSQGLEEKEILDIAEDLSEKATVLSSGFQCPKLRFGKTEIQIPIITCGGMRIQQTWCPDNLQLAPSRSRVLKGPCQKNLMNAVRLCLKVGINHFETARVYGTSEYQFNEALGSLIRNGEIKREDFILQTKVAPKPTRKEFEKLFEQSWANLKDLEYFDLFAFHCVSTKEQTEWLLAEGEDTCMAAVLEYQRQGKIKHIGFSTHGPADHILELINSEKFAFVNHHCHYMGSYHAEGTPDGVGGHGNKHAVKRAQELDMGAFLISPIDKGGHMYQPSKTFARILGPKMTPIEFGILSGLESGHQTASVGFSRVCDLEDAVSAARMYTKEGTKEALAAAKQRIDAQMERELGKEWYEKGLLNLPTCENESTSGTAMGHVLWCYNLMKAFGMYDFCYARYKNLKGCAWNKKKAFDDNRKAMIPGNMGRAYLPGKDYKEALKDHDNPAAALANMKQVDEWMKIDPKDTKTRRENGFDEAYDLRVWEEYAGSDPDVKGVVLQNLTFGVLGCGGGPTKQSADFAARLAQEVKS